MNVIEESAVNERAKESSAGRLEELLRSGQFAVTTELSPPDSADPEEVYSRARVFDGYVDAINATDGSGADCHLSSVGPLTSARAARWIRDNVPGVHIPDAVIQRLESADRPKLEGRRLCMELIQQVREIEGVAGVHVMAYRQEEAIAEIIDASGVLAGRVPWNPSGQASLSLTRAIS